MTDPLRPTQDVDYTRRLISLSDARWKQFFDVQMPYRWNLRRLRPGRVLDVGCGIGRNLRHLKGNGVGVDHNPSSLSRARLAGFTALLPEEFHVSEHAQPNAFDTLLFAHILEHLVEGAADALLSEYLPYVRPGGQVILITPQELGQASDNTHVRYVDLKASRDHLARAGVSTERNFSFPLPRSFGKIFRYNELVVVGRVPG